MGMLPRKLLDLGAHAPRQHQCDHLVVAHERPERILERRRPILLDRKVRQPRATVTGKQSEKKQPPSARRDQINHQRHTGRRPNQMQHTSRGPAVFRNVERPKLGKRFVMLICAHPRLSAAKFSSTCSTLLIPISAVVIPGVEQTNLIAAAGSIRPCNNDALATTFTPTRFAASTIG